MTEAINSILAQIFAWINVGANAVGGVLLAPVGHMPGWLSNTIISAVAGVGLLILFKYTSNQAAIGRVRARIKANMLALKLFKDDMSVTFRSQGRVFGAAFCLLFHSLRPLAVMIVPVVLLLAQMNVWYQLRPLQAEEEALVVLKLNGAAEAEMPAVKMEPLAGAAEVNIVRIPSRREVRWQIKAVQNGNHRMIFEVAGQKFDKELVVGAGFQAVNPLRPGWKWSDIVLYPREKPFTDDSIVQSISIAYPQRVSWTSGANWWLIYFFVVSIIFALIFKPIFKVRI